MADFKKLSAVEMVESAKDSATVLIEEDGVIKRTHYNVSNDLNVECFIVFTQDVNGGDPIILAATENLYNRIDKMFDNFTPCRITIYEMEYNTRRCWPCNVIQIQLRSSEEEDYYYLDGGPWIGNVYKDGRIRIEYYD